MKEFFEKWYVLFMLMRIARHNMIREKFERKYNDVFDDYGESLESVKFVKCHEKDGKLFKWHAKSSNFTHVASKPQRDDFGLYEYVDQRAGYCEDDWHGEIYTKTPFKNLWMERSFWC